MLNYCLDIKCVGQKLQRQYCLLADVKQREQARPFSVVIGNCCCKRTVGLQCKRGAGNVVLD